MLKGLASDLSGASDVCHIVSDLRSCQANAYLVPGEQIVFSFVSSKEEFSFTTHALLKIAGSSATTTRRLVERFRFKHEVVSHVKFETAGRVDRDCEIKFRIGSEHVSIDIARAEDDAARVYYKVIELLGREQRASERTWEFAKLSLKHASDALYLTENSGQTLGRQSDEALEWLQRIYERTHPESYREVIDAALLEVKTAGKMEEPNLP